MARRLASPPGPLVRIGASLILPSDVLAYRQTWDAYVMGHARAALAVSAAWHKLADGGALAPADAPVDTSRFATAPDHATLVVCANMAAGTADSITSAWNAYAGLSDSEIVLRAAEILRAFQSTVERVGTFYADQLRADAPTLKLPEPPSLDVQSQIIGRIEGAGVLAHGVLQFFGVGAKGALEALGGLGSAANDALKEIEKLVQTLLSTVVPLAIGGAVVLLAVLIHALGPALRAETTARLGARRKSP